MRSEKYASIESFDMMEKAYLKPDGILIPTLLAKINLEKLFHCISYYFGTNWLVEINK